MRCRILTCFWLSYFVILLRCQTYTPKNEWKEIPNKHQPHSSLPKNEPKPVLTITFSGLFCGFWLPGARRGESSSSGSADGLLTGSLAVANFGPGSAVSCLWGLAPEEHPVKRTIRLPGRCAKICPLLMKIIPVIN